MIYYASAPQKDINSLGYSKKIQGNCAYIYKQLLEGSEMQTLVNAKSLST